MSIRDGANGLHLPLIQTPKSQKKQYAEQVFQLPQKAPQFVKNGDQMIAMNVLAGGPTGMVMPNCIQTQQLQSAEKGNPNNVYANQQIYPQKQMNEDMEDPPKTEEKPASGRANILLRCSKYFEAPKAKQELMLERVEELLESADKILMDEKIKIKLERKQRVDQVSATEVTITSDAEELEEESLENAPTPVLK